MKNSFVLENGFFLLNDGSGSLLRGCLRVEDGKIAKIARSIAKKKGEKRTSLKGALVIPGFVQTHLHLCQTLFKNLADDLQLLDWLKFRIWPMEGAHTEASLYASARLGISELLAGGTTTILDMGTVRHTDQIFRAAEEMGIRAFIGKCLMDSDGNPKELREKTKEALTENLRLIETWHGKGKINYALAPRFLLSCTDQLLQEVGEISREKDILIHTHSSENKEEVAAVRKLHGCENVEAFEKLGLASERLVLAHCVHLNQQEENILRSRKIKVSHCPSSNLKLASGLCRTMDLRAKGINVSLGADGAPCNNNLNMFQEMRLASLLQKPLHGPKALSAREVFEMATLEGAKALGISQKVGSLELGKEADLVALSLENEETFGDLQEKHPERAYSALVYAAGPSLVQETWVAGKSVHRKGSMGREILEMALKERKKLLDRLS